MNTVYIYIYMYIYICISIDMDLNVDLNVVITLDTDIIFSTGEDQKAAEVPTPREESGSWWLKRWPLKTGGIYHFFNGKITGKWWWTTGCCVFSSEKKTNIVMCGCLIMWNTSGLVSKNKVSDRIDQLAMFFWYLWCPFQAITSRYISHIAKCHGRCWRTELCDKRRAISKSLQVMTKIQAHMFLKS